MENFGIIILILGASLKMVLVSIYVFYHSCCKRDPKAQNEPRDQPTTPTTHTGRNIRTALLRIISLPARIIRRVPQTDHPEASSLELVEQARTPTRDSPQPPDLPSEPPPSYEQVEESRASYPSVTSEATDIHPPDAEVLPLPVIQVTPPPPYTQAEPPPYSDTPPPYK